MKSKMAPFDPTSTNAIVQIVPGTRTLSVVGEVGDEMLSAFIPSFRQLDSKKGKITIVLSSDGGFMTAGFAVFDEIMRSKNDAIRIEGTGRIESMAVLILQAANERVLSPNCTLMIHNGSSGMPDATDPYMARSFINETIRLHKVYCEIISERTGLSYKKIRKLCQSETYLSAEKAVEMGFADRIER